MKHFQSLFSLAIGILVGIGTVVALNRFVPISPLFASGIVTVSICVLIVAVETQRDKPT